MIEGINNSKIAIKSNKNFKFITPKYFFNFYFNPKSIKEKTNSTLD